MVNFKEWTGKTWVLKGKCVKCRLVKHGWICKHGFVKGGFWILKCGLVKGGFGFANGGF